MTTKEKILELFEANRDTYFSGEDIARKLSVSRAAVWKAVKSLQSEGYAINAVTNKGYSLSAQTDIVSAPGILKFSRSEIADMEISVLPSAVSTNTLVKEKANSGASEGYMILAWFWRSYCRKIFFSGLCLVHMDIPPDKPRNMYRQRFVDKSDQRLSTYQHKMCLGSPDAVDRKSVV